MLITSCRHSRESVKENPSSAPELIASAVPPFSTREPERYRAVRTITSSQEGLADTVARSRIARDGVLRREEYEPDSADSVVYLEISSGRYLLHPASKLLADLNESTDLPSLTDEVTEFSSEFFQNQQSFETFYQRLGTDIIGGRSATKYRIVMGDPAQAETLMWIDEALKMPIRWETTSKERRTKTIMELSDITLAVEAQTFTLPSDYRRVDLSDLRTRLKTEISTGKLDPSGN